MCSKNSTSGSIVELYNQKHVGGYQTHPKLSLALTYVEIKPIVNK